MPGLHGGGGGFRYVENEDETYEYPPVVVSLGTGGKVEAGYLANQAWKDMVVVREIVGVMLEEEKAPIEDPNRALH